MGAAIRPAPARAPPEPAAPQPVDAYVRRALAENRTVRTARMAAAIETPSLAHHLTVDELLAAPAELPFASSEMAPFELRGRLIR